jgi:hypothetical protein
VSALYEYLMQARGQDIQRRIRRARPSARDVVHGKSDPTAKEHR